MRECVVEADKDCRYDHNCHTPISDNRQVTHNKKCFFTQKYEKICIYNPSKECQIPLLALDALLTDAERVLTTEKLWVWVGMLLYLHWNSNRNVKLNVKPKN